MTGLMRPGSSRPRSAAATTLASLRRRGVKLFDALGIDVDAARGSRRRFAFACLD